MRLGKALTQRSQTFGLQEWIDEYFSFNGLSYPFLRQPITTLGEKQEQIRGNFEGHSYGAFKANGIIFGCMLARQMLFAEARFQFRRRVLGRPGELFGTKALGPLEQPWPNGTTGDLLGRAIQDVDLGGNFFCARRPEGRLMRLRPDWMTLILGSMRDPDVGYGDVDAEVLGYIYSPGGPGSNRNPQTFLANEVAHWAPIPDPMAEFRGQSWLTPILRDLMGDQAATTHKLRFFENGAFPSMVVNMGSAVTDPDVFNKWVDRFEEQHAGALNAFKTVYLAAGSDAKVVGSDLKSIEMQAVQGIGEIRIAAAAGVPPIIAGLSEGLRAATLANYGQARRHFADATIRPLWRGISGALSTITEVPPGAELWYDSRDIAYLQDDHKDEAEVQQKQAETMKTLVEAGYTPESAQEAVTSNDMSRLKHSGLVSVQLQKPGSEEPKPEPAEPAKPSDGGGEGKQPEPDA